MSRKEEAKLFAKAEEAKRRLQGGLRRSKATVAQYRHRLLTLKAADKSKAAVAPALRSLQPRFN